MADTRKRARDEGDDEAAAASAKRVKREDPHEASALDRKPELEPVSLYLDTIVRAKLEVDVTKVCAVTLSALNVHVCLVCGKYLTGRGPSTHAYFHSLDEEHHLFMSVDTQKVYCLPDGVLVEHDSLRDIQALFNPRFTSEQIETADARGGGALAIGRDLHGVSYMPGIVGLNNLSQTDGMNVVFSVLALVAPLRSFFLRAPDLAAVREPVVHCLGALLRRMWHGANYKAHVAPHEMVQCIVAGSKKRFRPGQRNDPMALAIWLLNTLAAGLKPAGHEHVIDGHFRGRMRVIEEKVHAVAPGSARARAEAVEVISDKAQPFLCLTLDVPPPPLFQDNRAQNILHQVSLLTCLAKYDGVTASAGVGDVRRRHVVCADGLPDILVLHVKRFERREFFVEKLPTIVHAPIRGLDMRPFVDAPVAAERAVYNLLASVCHEGPADAGTFVVHVRRKATDQWYTIADLLVTPNQPETVATAEAYVLVYERE